MLLLKMFVDTLGEEQTALDDTKGKVGQRQSWPAPVATDHILIRGAIGLSV